MKYDAGQIRKMKAENFQEYDNTLQNAIADLMETCNELEAEGGSSTAEDITYETDFYPEVAEVGAALDQIFTVLDAVDASNIEYDNKTSGLEAEDVQAAIDEVYAAIPEIPTEYTAEDITYTNNVLTDITEVAGALDAIVTIIRGDFLTKIEVTVLNTQSSKAMDANASLIDGRIVSIVPVSGAESAVAGSSIDGTGVLTVTLVEAQTAGNAVFNVYVQKVVPA